MPDAPDQDRLTTYVEVWWSAVADALDLFDQVPDDAWHRPTDLPGWDVHDVVAHLAHLERVLADGADEPADPAADPAAEPPAHVRSAMGRYTEAGVVARRDQAPAALLAELREATARRHAALLADPPTDPAATADFCFGGMPWTWEALLGNRPLDVWMHEQDVRRAVGLPGGTDTLAARHTVDRLLPGQPFVLGKRVGAPPGTSVRWEVDGHDPLVVAVGDDGRAGVVAPTPGDEPTLTVACDRETFALLAAGRQPMVPVAPAMTGDLELGTRYLASMVTVP